VPHYPHLLFLPWLLSLPGPAGIEPLALGYQSRRSGAGAWPKAGRHAACHTTSHSVASRKARLKTVELIIRDPLGYIRADKDYICIDIPLVQSVFERDIKWSFTR
jgi:hypothetical protein